MKAKCKEILNKNWKEVVGVSLGAAVMQGLHVAHLTSRCACGWAIVIGVATTVAIVGIKVGKAMYQKHQANKALREEEKLGQTIIEELNKMKKKAGKISHALRDITLKFKEENGDGVVFRDWVKNLECDECGRQEAVESLTAICDSLEDFQDECKNIQNMAMNRVKNFFQ